MESARTREGDGLHEDHVLRLEPALRRLFIAFTSALRTANSLKPARRWKSPRWSAAARNSGSSRRCLRVSLPRSLRLKCVGGAQTPISSMMKRPNASGTNVTRLHAWSGSIPAATSWSRNAMSSNSRGAQRQSEEGGRCRRGSGHGRRQTLNGARRLESANSACGPV